MKAVSASLAAAFCLLAVPASAQQDDSGADNLEGPAAMRCSALADMEQAEQTTTVFYVAGYYDGQRDAMTIATVGQSAETAGEAADQQAATDQQTEADENGAAPARGGAEPAVSIPELALEAILAACAQSPDSRIADIITAHLGTRAG